MRKTGIGEIHRVFDLRWSMALKKTAEQGLPVSCFKGCSACCGEPMFSSKAEALHAIKHIPPGELEGVKERTRAWLASAESSGVLEEAEPNVMRYLAVEPKLVCPLLKGGECLVYEHRPIGCRAHCAVGPASKCTEDRARQRFMSCPELMAMTVQDVFALPGSQSEADHLGIWLARYLLGSSVRSADWTPGFGLERLQKGG